MKKEKRKTLKEIGNDEVEKVKIILEEFPESQFHLGKIQGLRLLEDKFRAEAVKRVKYLQSIVIDSYNYNYIKGRTNTFIQSFNLTEEDLK